MNNTHIGSRTLDLCLILPGRSLCFQLCPESYFMVDLVPQNIRDYQALIISSNLNLNNNVSNNNVD